ncbi:MAG: hypothetical protein IJ520_06460, partial [Synergistaceae bacterium]|nr:hypothetical protein [Synergistaceae bacterium]
FLSENPELQQEIIDAIMAEVGKGMGLMNVNDDNSDSEVESEASNEDKKLDGEEFGEFDFDSAAETEAGEGQPDGDEILDLDTDK